MFSPAASQSSKLLASDRPEMQVPSRVLFVRNLPEDVVEQDLHSLSISFGGLQKVLMLRPKNQAFVQLPDVNAAQQMVNYFASYPAMIRGKHAVFSYSARDEITAATPQLQDAPNRVLLVAVTNLLYSVNVDVLSQVFSKYGNVLRIVTFTKNGEFQALVEFSDVESASLAKQTLNGLNIYSGCCSLKILFSSMPALQVKYNNEKSRDYTDPTLPSGPSRSGSGSGSGGDRSPPPSTSTTPSPVPTSTTTTAGGLSPTVAPPAQSSTATTTLSPTIQPPTAAFYPTRPHGYQHHQHQQHMGGAPRHPSHSHSHAHHAQQHHHGGMIGPGGPVLLVNNVPEGTTCDMLATLFGVFGDVLRVKLLYNKKGAALLQFRDPSQAVTALTNLHGVHMFGRPLGVHFSRLPLVHLPTVINEESLLTKDYTTSPLHRYKIANSKNFMHINPPSDTVHVSSLPAPITEDGIRALFAEFGPVANVRLLATPNPSKKMAIVQLPSIDHSVRSLIALDNRIVDGQHIRLSFSRSASLAAAAGAGAGPSAGMMMVHQFSTAAASRVAPAAPVVASAGSTSPAVGVVPMSPARD